MMHIYSSKERWDTYNNKSHDDLNKAVSTLGKDCTFGMMGWLIYVM